MVLVMKWSYSLGLNCLGHCVKIHLEFVKLNLLGILQMHLKVHSRTGLSITARVDLTGAMPVKEGRHQRAPIVSVYCYKVQKQVKLICAESPLAAVIFCGACLGVGPEHVSGGWSCLFAAWVLVTQVCLVCENSLS